MVVGNKAIQCMGSIKGLRTSTKGSGLMEKKMETNIF